MKKGFILFLLTICFEGYSQITLDFQTPLLGLQPIKLSNSETKYFEVGEYILQDQFPLYNLDGTLFKMILMPPTPDPTAFYYDVYYISRSLFDNDPSNIEYIVNYVYDSIPGCSYVESKVIREDGTILFDEMNSAWSSVYSTEEGTKLMLWNVYATGVLYQKSIFSLPGELPTGISDNINVTNNEPLLYPNPNKGSFFINLNSKAADFNTIDLYSASGKLIDTYKSSGNLVHISNYGLSNGMYFVNTRSKYLNSVNKMIISK